MPRLTLRFPALTLALPILLWYSIAKADSQIPSTYFRIANSTLVLPRLTLRFPALTLALPILLWYSIAKADSQIPSTYFSVQFYFSFAKADPQIPSTYFSIANSTLVLPILL